ncbi:hypothetical protein [uncultured Tenacibaculum sp.]|uniref:hypothetical protein n=1 Tax=uncultured Tenacibaculum sp. TaxID=174713 RepID=UPI002636B81C|nr:hypothetical protein [uncultured Tenacibaculum sp.]
MKNLFLLFSLSILLCCKNNTTQFDNAKNCVEVIMKKDDSLGSIRNHDSKNISLSKTIDKYTLSVENLNFQNCSKNFKTAFQNHLSAWKNMKQVTDNHPHLRGEMHALFDSIKKTNDSLAFSNKLDAIFNTWKEVEIAKEPFKVSE